MKSAVIIVFMMVITMIANGWILMVTEDWVFVEAVYYWFITFSTIGFGDFVPTPLQPKRIKNFSMNNTVDQESMIKSMGAKNVFLLIFFMLIYVINLCIVSSAINSIVATVEERKHHSHCFGCVPRNIQDHSESQQNKQSGREDTNTRKGNGKLHRTLSN